MAATTERQYMNGIMYRRVTVWLPEEDVLKFKRLGGLSIHLRKACKEHSAYLDVLCNVLSRLHSEDDLKEIVLSWV